MNWLKHAFAIDSADEQLKPNETQHRLIEKLCGEVVRRRMTAPALFLLEMSRPLNYVGSQFLRFVQPLATAIADADAYQQLVVFLEHRASIDYICKRLEALEVEHVARQHLRNSKAAKAVAPLDPPEPHAKP